MVNNSQQQQKINWHSHPWLISLYRNTKEVFYLRRGVIDVVKIGASVVYVDEYGVEHDALVTNVFSATCVNVVYVSGDETQSDSYGRQIKRETSQVHKSIQTAPGRYWFVR